MNNNAYITTKQIIESGLSKDKLYTLVNNNKLEKVGHGIYIKPEEILDELYLLHLRCNHAVFSHDEAFYYHGLTDREPLVHTMTVYSGYNSHRLVKDNCKIYTVKKELVGVGLINVRDNFGNIIPIYNLERTICDLFRSRNKLELDEFKKVLSNYLKRKDKNLDLLYRYAKLFKIENICRKYIELNIL